MAVASYINLKNHIKHVLVVTSYSAIPLFRNSVFHVLQTPYVNSKNTMSAQTCLRKPYNKPYIKASQVFDLDIKQLCHSRCKISSYLA